MSKPVETSSPETLDIDAATDVASTIEHDESYRTDRVLASRDGQTTEVVWLGDDGPYVRKRMQASLTSRTAWRRLGEAESDHLPKLVDLYELPGEVVAVTTYVRGETLADLVQHDGRLSPAEAVRILLDVADAAQALHDVGVVHRDITPRNVMAGPDGVYLVDLGISRLSGVDEDESKRHDTHILGTWGFASPEQYGFGVTDARSDVWSMGRLFAFLLTGRYPNDPGFEEALEDPSVVPEVFREVIDHACALAPAARPRDAKDFGRELADALDEYRDRRRTRRHRNRVMTVVGICLVAALGLSALVAGVFPGLTEREPIGSAAIVAEAQKAVQEAESSDIHADGSDGDLEGSENGIYGSFFELGSSLGENLIQGILGGGSDELEERLDEGATSTVDPNAQRAADMPFKVDVVSARLVKDYKGDLAALVTIDFTNGSDETTNLTSQFSITAYQDGRQLRRTGSPDFDLQSASDNIRPGVGTTCYELFALTSKNPIDVEVTYYANYSAGPFLSKTFDL